MSQQVCKNGKDCKFGKECKYLHTENKVQFKFKPKKESSFKKGQNVLKNKMDVIKPILRNASVLIDRKKQCLAEKTEFEKKYVGIDVKGQSSTPYDDKLALIESELKVARSSIRAGLGDKPFKIILPVFKNMITGTSGGLQDVSPVDPSVATEFASLAALFDEYKCIGGEVHFNVNGLMPVATVSATLDSPMLVMIYDPVDATGITDIADGCQLEQKTIVPITCCAAAAGTVLPTNGLGPNQAKIHKFKFHVPKQETLIFSAAGALVTGNGWQATITGSSLKPYGYCQSWARSFLMNGAATPTYVVSAMTYLHCEFRCRQ